MTELPRYEYVRIADAVAAEIVSGRLPVGARLPGEREALSLYSTSIGTWRRTVRELRERGLVATLPAKGTFVIAAPEPPSAQG
ncbi:GntR family transcriptional regulator [Streptomyces sp. NPDC058739]|uniref:GntR family transcriptional regulator n=1 Tax=Streptomyces sp. NPDC058739 TaxID=3346618 RepID=UPI0036D08C20